MSTTILAERSEARTDTAGPQLLTEAAAKRLTERIRKGIEGVWAMIYEAFEGQAHTALGYDTWETYVKTEFQMSRGESYRQVDKGRVIKALASASSVSHARDIAPYVSIRAASVLKADAEPAAREITEAIDAGMEPQEAVRAAVARRLPAESLLAPPPVPQLPPAFPSAVRKGANNSDEDILSAASELRDRLRIAMSTVRGNLSKMPKREAEDPESLREELRQWVVALSHFTRDDGLRGLYLLQAELFDWLLQLGDERAAIGNLAGVTAANVDYWRTQLRNANKS